jgi:hypothetical protein
MYKIYPTLLNTYSMYLNETKNSAGELMVPFEEMIDRINRVKKPTTQAQQKGINFETALTTGSGEEQFPENILEKMRSLLPPKYKTQFYVQTVVGEVQLYGYVDLVGGNKAYDIKTTRSYTAPKFEDNFQNLYLLGLKKWGITTLDYLITDFTEVYVESYDFDSYNFSPLLEVLDNFVWFLEQHRKVIRDKKIFDEKLGSNQLSLF